MKTYIKFRGYFEAGKKWVYGDLIHGQGDKYGELYILPQTTVMPFDCHSLDGYKVVNDSVGMSTNLKDKNNNDIYEGDILGFNTGEGRGFWKSNLDVLLPPIQFGLFNNNQSDLSDFIGFHIDNSSIHYKLTHGCHIAGNIFENPDLLN